MNGTPWQHRAECRDADPDTFFLRDNEPVSAGRFNDAELMCRACPVVAECDLDGARSSHGFWAHKLRDKVDKARIREVVTI